MHRRTIIAALTAVTALTIGAPATAQPIEPAHVVKSCNLGFMPMKPTVTGPSILGNAWALCDVPPESHTLSLALDRREGGTWRSYRMEPFSQIPNPRLVYEIKTACQPGMWRVSATVTGSLGGVPFEFSDSSMERFVTDADCARGR